MDILISQVVEIPDSKTIIVSKTGLKDIRVGTKIEVFEKGHVIIDPTSKEELGRFDFVKESLEVTEVYENFIVCQKIVRKQANALQAAVTPLLQSKTYSTAEPLYIDDNSVKNWKISNPKITIGDPVRKKL